MPVPFFTSCKRCAYEQWNRSLNGAVESHTSRLASVASMHHAGAPSYGQLAHAFAAEQPRSCVRRAAPLSFARMECGLQATHPREAKPL
jgi:hypothetical protein